MKTLILGAGYAGLAVATRLKPTPGLQVLLVEQNAYHTFETRLHEAAAHNTRVTLPLAPLLRGTGVEWEQAKVEGVDLDGNTAIVTPADAEARNQLTRQAADRGMVEFARLRPSLGDLYREAIS